MEAVFTNTQMLKTHNSQGKVRLAKLVLCFWRRGLEPLIFLIRTRTKKLTGFT